MIGRFLHPSASRLDRFMDGALGARHRARIAAHLGRCPRCFEHIRSSGELARRIRDLHVSDPSPAVLERIRTTLASGATVLVPIEGPVRVDPPARKLRRLTIPGTLVALAALMLVVIVPTVEARHGTLTFSDSDPRAGEPIRLSYRGGLLAGVGEPLRARVRLYGEEDQVETLSVPLTARRSGDRHEADLALPAWAVYAAFAVEDTTGAWVDANYGRLWDVLVHDAEGRPRFEALRRQAGLYAPDRPSAALESARAMVAYYPERPESWRTLLALEGSWAERERLDSLEVTFEDRFRSFEKRFETSSPSPDDLAAMTLFARTLGDESAAERWQSRLLRDAPHVRLAVQLRLLELAREHARDPVALLEHYERMWQETGPQRDIAASAFGLATQARIGDATLRWADRLVRLDPAARASVAIRLSTIPESRDAGMRRIRSELRRLDEGADAEARPLDRSVPEHQVVEEEMRRRLMVALGTALIDEGRHRAGTDTLRVAAELGWDPEVFRTVAGTLSAVGDSVDAVGLLARVVVDPETTPAERNRLTALAHRHVTHWEWEDHAREAQRRMQRQLLAQAVRVRLPRTITVEDQEGRALDLRSALGGEVAVVSLWHCLCAQHAALIEQHEALREKLNGFGVRMITVVTARTGLPGRPHTGTGSRELPHFYDHDGQARRAFISRGTPSYFVVDGEGFIRFRHMSPDRLLRQALVLEGGALPPAFAPE